MSPSLPRIMPLGTRVAKEQVKAVGWPAATPLDGSFDSVDAVVGRGPDCSRWRRTNR